MASRTPKSPGGMSRPEAPSKGAAKASTPGSDAQSERARGTGNASKRSGASREKKPSGRNR